MSERDKRDDLLKLANDVNKLRLDLLAVINLLNRGICVLVGASDATIMQVADEGERDKPKPVKITTNVEEVVESEKPNQRKCSTCGKPGHRATTCPDADKARKRERAAEKEEQPPKKEPGKRYCGKCGFPGHRAKNCMRK